MPINKPEEEKLQKHKNAHNYSETSLIRPALGPKKIGLNNKVASLMRSLSTVYLYLEPYIGGQYNEVVLLKRWPLSEVPLYIRLTLVSNING